MLKPIVLHLGDAIKYNHEFYNEEFLKRFNVVRNNTETREQFIEALKNKRLIGRKNRFGSFSAIFRPHFQTGGEMGQWDDELIGLLPDSVRIFASAGAGFNWADVDALGRRMVLYANGAGASDEAVSDTALWMILSVFRNFTMQTRAASTADPAIFTATHKMVGHISCNPGGHILGIVGLGNISKKLALKAQAIGMTVHYYDVVRQNAEEGLLKVTYQDSLKSLLQVADCVSLHTPLNEHTRHLINAETLSFMKDGARLVNTARGEVSEASGGPAGGPPADRD
ncbi:putative alcohol dehydrogenase [Colletotrichum sublineola]|uniref:Putative alcohol dehydrogenase n=1 Tax=Colletotrichum sublineola TaxID=1173701 RepID=A0A066XTN3_COLSU|nr:putative alcohol dehydrogenase [Colletotrichum sublineola]